MELILPEGDLDSLCRRIETRFGIRMEARWSDNRGGLYRRWPKFRPSLLDRVKFWHRRKAPPFGELLLFWNSDTFDDEPHIEGFPPQSFIVHIDRPEGTSAMQWFLEQEGATLVRE